MIYAIYFIHILVSIFLILVVLLQQGKGADLSVFGGGGTQTAFGARGAATVLHKLTVTCFILFLVTTVTLGIMSSGGGSSVMQGVDAVEEEPLPESTDGPAGGTLDDLEPAVDDSGDGDATEAPEGSGAAEGGGDTTEPADGDGSNG